jgi:hypothetical protein
MGTFMLRLDLPGSAWPLGRSSPDLETDRSPPSLTAVSSSSPQVRESSLPSLVGLSLVPPTE